jgi:hypothetical protein
MQQLVAPNHIDVGYYSIPLTDRFLFVCSRRQYSGYVHCRLAYTTIKRSISKSKLSS